LSDSHRTALCGGGRATRSRRSARRGDTMRRLRSLSSAVTLVRGGGLVLVATCLSAPAPAQEPDEPKETQQGKPGPAGAETVKAGEEGVVTAPPLGGRPQGQPGTHS